jgi:hypothetical protein
MALNLVRNSRVFFTTNVDTNGKIKSTGFSATNTQEIQVLDGFTFSQNTNADTVTLSEAGGDPIRGQRSFNTSLAPVDFSFSTYVRPALVSSAVAAEESVLWNALLSTRDIDPGVSVGGTGASYTWTASTGTGQIALTGLNFTPTVTISTGDAVIIGGVTNGDTDIQKALNGAAIVKSVTASSGVVSALTLEYVSPYAGAANPTVNASGTKIFTSAGWASTTLGNAGTAIGLSTVAGSNKNQLQKFGMLFVVDNVTYAVDNCAMNQVTLDFGLDAIATLAWTGQATTLRDVTSLVSLSTASPMTLTAGTPNTITNILSTENIFIGNILQYTSTGSTNSTAAAVAISKITGANSLEVTGSSGSGTLSNVKVFNYTGTGTSMSTVTGTGPWTVTITGINNTQGISVNDVVTATSGAAGTNGTWGTGTATVKSVDSASQITVTFTGGTAPSIGSSNGNVTALYVQIATLAQIGATQLLAAAKNTTAPFITNKLSTVTFKTLNPFKDNSGNTLSAATTYKIALTGGSITINNNISYVTPANLGVVNVPAVYYTGTRSITGTLNAYLKTGTDAGTGTGQLLQDMLAAVSSTVEPMASLNIGIGGNSVTTNRVELDMPSVTFTVPSVDVQQVISTAINFTAAGSVLGATAGNTFAVDELNDLTVRYYAV